MQRWFCERLLAGTVLSAAMGFAPGLRAQTATAAAVVDSPAAVASSSSLATPEVAALETPALPEAPSAMVFLPGQDAPLRASVPPQDPTSPHPPVAPLRWKYIPAGYAYQHLSAKDKIYIGLRDTVSVGDLGDWFVSAGWSHLTNGQPHYGTDRGAFGERLGAAAINETAQGILDDSVFAVLFKEDPRYFTEGPRHDFLHRSFHAVSRVVVTRNDNGTHGPNYALFASYAATAGLDTAFYPREDRDLDAYFTRFGGSLGGAALGYALDEFMDDALIALHLKKKP